MRQGLLRDALTRLGEKWTPGLICELAEGPRRYGELRRELGIAPKVLTSTLRNLERDGFVSRLQSPSIPLQVSYELTRLGRSFHELLLNIEGWAANNAGIADVARGASSVDRFSTRAPVDRDACDGDGRNRLDAWPTHLCIAVRDVETAAAVFSSLFGVAGVPSASGTVVGPGDCRGDIKQCAFPMSNFCIELIQPVNGSTPFRDFLRRFGQGFHHIGMRVRGSLEQEMRLLTQRGGRRILGGMDARYALFDFSRQLGSTVEIIAPDMDRRSTLPPRFHSPDALAHSSLGHIGILVRDIRHATEEYARVLGVTASAVRTATPVFPGSAEVDSKACARYVTVRYGGIAIMLIEPVGSSPWREFVDQHGNAIQHVSFNVNDRLDEIIRLFEQWGGRRVLGRPGVHYAHFDFTSELGLVIGLTGRSLLAGHVASG
jgi:DNA-binding HxlR family transcriptional regulator